MLEKLAKTIYPINQLIAKRWSTRAFIEDKEVQYDDIIKICEAARWAPSCFGDEPWKFIVWNKFSDYLNYSKALDVLSEWNQKWCKTAPVLIASIANKHFKKNGEFNRWAQYDLGSATQNMFIQAIDLGLMVHPMGGFDEIKLKNVFNIPNEFEIMAISAVGYQAEPGILSENYLKSETAERKRNDLNNDFYDSTWGNGIWKI